MWNMYHMARTQGGEIHEQINKQGFLSFQQLRISITNRKEEEEKNNIQLYAKNTYSGPGPKTINKHK